MKRGLKARENRQSHFCTSCSNLCPDEKGTERSDNQLKYNVRDTSSNLCPDEKGTESHGGITMSRHFPKVATYAPMKRGLKGNISPPILFVNSSSNLCPDEKGTERYELPGSQSSEKE